MPLDPELLEILACPVCKVPVRLEEDQSGLFCAQCTRVYRIEDDIPVMLEEEAIKKGEESPSGSGD